MIHDSYLELPLTTRENKHEKNKKNREIQKPLPPLSIPEKINQNQPRHEHRCQENQRNFIKITNRQKQSYKHNLEFKKGEKAQA